MPQHLLSRLMGLFGNATCTSYKNWMIRTFIRHYGVDMSEAAQPDYTQYKSFNSFFTRQLKPGARQLDHPEGVIISPADGAISELGHIADDQMLQAKGHTYSVDALVADERVGNLFRDGSFITVYLSPKDYHRVHMPFGGRLMEMTYVPGKLFSVNEATAQGLPGLFAMNERVVCLFETSMGPMAVILVGAMIVASIHTAWHGVVAPQRCRQVTTWKYDNQEIILQRGDEMGFFQMGSTAIVLFPKNAMRFREELAAGGIRLGDALT